MIKFVVRYSAVVVLLLPFMAGANCLIPGYKATYDLNAGGASGTLVQSLQVTDNHQYILSNITKAHVLFFSDSITEISQGLIRGKSIVPMQYNVVDTHENQPFSVRFNWQQKMATTTYNHKTATLRNLPANTEDNLSYQLAMSRDLSAKGYHKMFNFPVVALDANKQPVIKNIIYSAPHQQMLQTPLGNLQTYRLINQDSHEGSVTTLWLAPKYHNVIVKSQTQKAGEVKATLILKAYQKDSSCVIEG